MPITAEMRPFFPLLFLAHLALGCAGLGATPETIDIRQRHPVGYTRTLEVTTDCAQVRQENYSACLISAQMFESATTQLSTHRFLTYWKEISFGDWVDSRNIQNAEKIVIPVLKFLYRFSRDDYSRAMLKVADKIVLTSPESFEFFTKIHLRNMERYGKFVDRQ